MKEVSVIIPAYNEAETLFAVVSRSSNALKKLKGEIIVIDDGSTDRTKEVTERLLEKYSELKVCHHRKNLGKTEALLSGLKISTGKIIVFMEADMESDPEEDIPRLLGGMQRFDMVVGWRQGRKKRKIASKIYNILSKLLFGIKIHDLNWIKAFKREMIPDLELRSDWHRYIAIFAHAKGYKVGEVKVRAYTRKFGKSKYGLMRILIGLLDMLVVKFNLSFLKRPMLIFGITGIFSMLIGVLIGLWEVRKFLIPGAEINTNIIALVILLVVLGVQFFGMGFLAEILVSIKEKIDRK
ncbi:MAG: glycosyltransferase family 2 protein [bacterium]|nr:glycosyltransferase family 2 protein [bacterium]